MLAVMIAIALLGSLVIVGLRFGTEQSVRDATYVDPQLVPEQDLVVVLASGARRTGPSAAAVRRLETALRFLATGHVVGVLLSGQTFEVSAMQRYLLDHGVDPTKISLDPSSERTLDSCEFLRASYPGRSIALVSQREHVTRAVYTCRELGVNAIGIVADDFEGPDFLWYRIHEVFALPLAWWELNVAQHIHSLLGPSR